MFKNLLFSLVFVTFNLYPNTLGLNENDDGTWDVTYSSEEIIAGFQFNVVDANINSAFGGDASANGFMISSSTTTVIAFSLTGSTIPIGGGTLVVLDLTGTPTGLSNIIVSDPIGGNLNFTFDDGSGCIDELACNYDPGATQDDGSCEYSVTNYDCEGNCVNEDECGVCGGDNTSCLDCADVLNGDSLEDNCGVCDNDLSNDCVQDCDGTWGGDALEDECGVCNGDGSSCAEYIIDILYDSDTPIAGFQFVIENATLMNASGGAAADAGFTVSTGNNTIIGFSLTGATIPAGSGVLTTLVVQGTGACISDLILSDSGGIGLDADILDCLTIYYVAPVPGCTDSSACNFDEAANVDDGSCLSNDCAGECGGSAVVDECGVCGGDGISEGECDCDGNIEDCDGICGGDAFEDDCGVCNGDGTSCLFATLYFGALSDNNLEVWLDSPLDVAGFQFEVSGITITGASGGSASDAGFTVSFSTTTVIGFSLTGTTIPASDGVLLNLTFDGVTGDGICLSAAVISDISANGITTEYGACLDPEDYFNGGCSDMSACNYMENIDFDDGSCTYAEENYDCEGNCIVDIDCNGDCGGSAVVDECGVCGGNNISCADCAGVPNGDALEDECGVCNGDGSSCAEYIIDIL
ncbi:uncharacterized protein METZ01_LOCUS137503, partial [marine metagenome]